MSSDAEKVLDHGYLRLVESWGSDERAIESARMSTAKGFQGWGPIHADDCAYARNLRAWVEEETYPVRSETPSPAQCTCEPKPGDEKLLRFLWDHDHATPFEMAGFTVEVKAPIFVFREWMRHRVPFGYNEMSARYVPLPDENYVPSVERLLANAGTTNKQAQGTGGQLDEMSAEVFRGDLLRAYAVAQRVYEYALARGVPKELARLCLPVGRYSVMRATSNLRGWLAFCKLRCAPNAQAEIRAYANAVAAIVRDRFPRTYDVARESVGMP